jgi:Rrf2 family protein
MFQLSKRVEYGLIALRHMAASPRGAIHTTKEIATKYHLPYDLLAKIMQKLAKKHYISSYQGVNGGYILNCDPNFVTISEIINAIEDKSSLKIIQCEAQQPEDCIIHMTCTIKDPLVKLQTNINSMLEHLTVTQLI